MVESNDKIKLYKSLHIEHKKGFRINLILSSLENYIEQRGSSQEL